MDCFLSQAKGRISRGQRTILISDERVFSLYAKRVSAALGCSDWIVVPESEACKTRAVKARVEDQLLSFQVRRSDALIALGGGALCDLVGFVAATYMRGLDYYCIPTTLLAMVDACIGGKCAINTPMGKNLIGAFHEPRALFYSPLFLQSLSKRRMNEAMAEVIKYGVIADKEVFSMLSGPIELLIERCQSIKRRITDLDKRDRGIRATLNFGHTIGHAVESLSNYRLSHGEAVSIGICAELELSHRYYGFLCKDIAFVKGLLASYDLPVSLEGVSLQELLERSMYDKKAAKSPRFVVTKRLGCCEALDGSYLKEFSSHEIKGVLCMQ